MTNVVGILIIVLIVAQVNVAEAVKRIRKDLKPVSAREMATLEAERDRVEEQRRKLDEAPDKAIAPSELRKLREELAKLKTEMKAAEEDKKKMEALAAQIAEKEKELEKLVEMVKTEEEFLVGLDNEAAQFDLTKKPVKKVRMPNPRDPYEDAKEVLFYCKGDRVMHVDYPGLLAKVYEAMNRNREIIYEKTDKRTVFKQEPSKAFVKQKNIRDTNFVATINPHPNRAWAQLIMTPDIESGGETITDAAKHNSRLRKHFNKARSDRNYLLFIVHPDAFETYLLARRIAEEQYVPIGWQPTGAKDIRRSLSGIRFHFEPPPPPKDGAKPKPRPPKKKPKLLD